MSDDPQNPHLESWIEPGLEARVVAWVLGEASAFEVAELERLAAEKPELAIFKRRLEAVHGLLGEAAKADREPLQLSPERRQKLLAAIGVAGAPAAAVAEPVVLPAAQVRRKRPVWHRVVFYAAACLVVLGISSIIIPTVGTVRSSALRSARQRELEQQNVEAGKPVAISAGTVTVEQGLSTPNAGNEYAGAELDSLQTQSPFARPGLPAGGQAGGGRSGGGGGGRRGGSGGVQADQGRGQFGGAASNAPDATAGIVINGTGRVSANQEATNMQSALAQIGQQLKRQETATGEADSAGVSPASSVTFNYALRPSRPEPQSTLALDSSAVTAAVVIGSAATGADQKKLDALNRSRQQAAAAGSPSHDEVVSEMIQRVADDWSVPKPKADGPVIQNRTGVPGAVSSTTAATALVIDNGTLEYTGKAPTSDRLFTLGSRGGILDASGTGAIDQHNFVRNGVAPAVAGVTPSMIGGEFTSPASNTKAGTGQWGLSSDNTFTGGVVMSGSGSGGGNLAFVNGSLTSGESFKARGLTAASTYTGVSSGGLVFSDTDSSGSSANHGQQAGHEAYVLNGGNLVLGSGSSVNLGVLRSNNGLAPLTGGTGKLVVSNGGSIIVGSLVKTGSGNVSLSGTNTYTGGTVVNGGTYMVGSMNLNQYNNFTGDSRSNSMVASGTATDREVLAQDTLTASGNIVGSGGLVKTDDSVLYLTGNNSYTGGTVINAGTLQVSSDNTLGDVILDGAKRTTDSLGLGSTVDAFTSNARTREVGRLLGDIGLTDNSVQIYAEMNLRGSGVAPVLGTDWKNHDIAGRRAGVTAQDKSAPRVGEYDFSISPDLTPTVTQFEGLVEYGGPSISANGAAPAPAEPVVPQALRLFDRGPPLPTASENNQITQDSTAGGQIAAPVASSPNWSSLHSAFSLSAGGSNTGEQVRLLPTSAPTADPFATPAAVPTGDRVVSQEIQRLPGSASPAQTAHDSVMARKMSEIIIPELQLRNATLDTVIATVSRLAEQNDKSSDAIKGINLILNAPGAKSPTVSVSLRNLSLSRMLAIIARQIGYEVDDSQSDKIILSPAGREAGTQAADLPAAKPKIDPAVEARKKALAEIADAEVKTVSEPVSTFSLHVSDVSFKLAQAALAKGQQPDPASIRPEEFYNAFDYGDPSPVAGEPVACRIEQSAHPVLQQRNLVRIALRVPTMGRDAGQPLRLTVLLDTSGSMEREDRAATVHAAMAALASLLGPNDVVTLIGFARQPRLLAQQLPGSQAGQLVTLTAHLPFEGGTNLEEALKLAGEMAQRQQVPGAQNRIVLLTDGAANLGDANADHLAGQITALRQQGITFDACGVVADGLNDDILEALTRKGDGRYYLLSRPEDADAGFARQLAGAFRPAAENVKVQVRFNPARVASYRLIGFEQNRLKTEDFHNDQVTAAQLAAEEAAVALYQVEVLPQGAGELGDVSVRFRETATGGMVERTWTMIHDPQAPAFDRATPTMQLAGTAALLAEKLHGGAVSGLFQLGELAPTVNALRGRYAQEPRVRDLVTMYGQLRRMTGE